MQDEKKLDAVFGLRYAMRVLERHANMWHLVAMCLKFLSVMGGSVAVGSAVAGNDAVAMVFAVFFAAVQALDLTLSATEISILSRVQQKQYGSVWAKRSDMTTSDLQQAYDVLVANDEISPPKFLRELAYDDVVIEHGLDPSACFGGHKLAALLS